MLLEKVIKKKLLELGTKITQNVLLPYPGHNAKGSHRAYWKTNLKREKSGYLSKLKFFFRIKLHIKGLRKLTVSNHGKNFWQRVWFCNTSPS